MNKPGRNKPKNEKAKGRTEYGLVKKVVCILAPIKSSTGKPVPIFDWQTCPNLPIYQYR